MSDPLASYDSNLASRLYPPEKDPFNPKPAVPVAESPAGKSPEPLGTQPQPAQAAPESPQATHEPSMAERFYGSDAEREATDSLNVNPEGMAPDNPGQYSITVPEGWTMDADGEAELSAVREGFHAVGLPQQMADDFVSTAVAAASKPVTTTEIEVNAELRRVYGGKADEKMALARQAIAKAAAKWPGIYTYLNSNNLGNDISLIKKTIARAEVMKRKGQL